MGLGLATALAIAYVMPMKAEGADVDQSEKVSQGTNGFSIIVKLTNNDLGTVYDSATFNLDGILGKIADAIIANNTNYTGYTRSGIYSNINYSVLNNSFGEDGWGWSAIKQSDDGIYVSHVQGGREGRDYTSWKYTNMLMLNINYLGNMTDLNNNQILDENEKIELSTNKVTDAFIPKESDGSTWPADAYSYQLKQHTWTIEKGAAINAIITPGTITVPYGTIVTQSVQAIVNDLNNPGHRWIYKGQSTTNK